MLSDQGDDVVNNAQRSSLAEDDPFPKSHRKSQRKKKKHGARIIVGDDPE